MRLLSKLRHPNITTVMGAVIDGGGEPLLVMELMVREARESGGRGERVVGGVERGRERGRGRGSGERERKAHAGD